jgi:hypothetical protein
MTCHTSPRKCKYPDCACPPDRMTSLEAEVVKLREQVDQLLAERRSRLETRDRFVKRQIGLR